MNLKEELSLQQDLQNIDFVKGIYKDNSENRKKGRVGQKFGGKEEEGKLFVGRMERMYGYTKTKEYKDLSSKEKKLEDEYRILSNKINNNENVDNPDRFFEKEFNRKDIIRKELNSIHLKKVEIKNKSRNK